MPDEKLTGHLVLATSYSRTAYRRTTIGAAAFHFRVRNGNGWCHCAIVTRVRNRTGGSLLSQRRKREAESLETSTIQVNRPYLKIRFQKNNQLSADSLISTYRSSKFRLRTADATRASFCFEIFWSPLFAVRHQRGRVNRKVKDQAERVISTPELNTLLCLHPEPINVVVYHDPSGRSHLGIGLALRCFQRLSFPNIATQHCR